MSVAPEFTEQDGTEAKKRADREVDTAGENYRRHDHSQKTYFDGVAEDIAGVVVGGEAAANGIEIEPFENEDKEQNGFVAENGCLEKTFTHNIAIETLR
ncbi:MAG: hypothetical protein C5B44_04975 [Acidobacteria bacterium]|nr:MAG: hypothetical protein C5B44_04975 [Acidobacteriota bacterium]